MLYISHIKEDNNKNIVIPLYYEIDELGQFT